MRLLVTGGSGFIGRYFVKLAVESGHEITVLMGPNSPSHELIKNNVHLVSFSPIL